jgi:hypothetical protein
LLPPVLVVLVLPPVPVVALPPVPVVVVELVVVPELELVVVAPELELVVVAPELELVVLAPELELVVLAPELELVLVLVLELELELEVVAMIMHVPALHTPPGQAVPSGALGFEQVPLVGLQTPASWQASGAGQVTGLPPVHTPIWQVSVRLHALPSLQGVASGLSGLEHPVAGLQVPAEWH